MCCYGLVVFFFWVYNPAPRKVIHDPGRGLADARSGLNYMDRDASELDGYWKFQAISAFGPPLHWFEYRFFS